MAYSVKGSGINGTDYAFLKGLAKIKAVKTRKVIKVTPLGNGEGAKRAVKLTLLSGSGYTLGESAPVKVEILPATP